jgi:hypothetical protein
MVQAKKPRARRGREEEIGPGQIVSVCLPTTAPAHAATHTATRTHATTTRTHAFSGANRGGHIRQCQASFPCTRLHAGMMFGADSFALLNCFGSAQFVAVLDTLLLRHQLAAVDLFTAGGLLLNLFLLLKLLLDLFAFCCPGCAGSRIKGHNSGGNQGTFEHGKPPTELGLLLKTSVGERVEYTESPNS